MRFFLPAWLLLTSLTLAEAPPSIDFDRDIQPILTRLGCNSGPCHGKQRGQNGFQLSLLGFDSNFDHDALTKEARGRRVSFSQPEHSLLLLKPTGQVPHGGGLKLVKGSPAYNTLLAWIAAQAPRSIPGTPALAKVTVAPTERILKYDERQQLTVTAHYADGSSQDVTHLAAFQSSESPIVGVNEHGLMQAGKITGESTVMARYRYEIATCQVAVPLPGEVPADYYAGLPKRNFIDPLVWQQLRKLQLQASETAPAHTLLRRAYLDIIGRPPTAEEARAYLSSEDPQKREKLIDQLLENPEFGEHWANKWADLLRPNPYRVGIKATLSFDTWIRDSFRKNKPYDQFVHELLTAQGSTFRNGAVVLFRDRREPDELTTVVSQLFLGIRLECAKCHHHPFERWGQDDFYSFAAYFARIGRKGTGLSPPISGSEEIFFASNRGSVQHPLTGAELPPRPLFGTAPPIAEDQDPRVALADWITKDNPFFAQVMVNRVWADLMGRGMVEPVDDLRGTNPASNPALLKALGEDFQSHGYDLKHLLRTITNSAAYSLSSLPNERNLVDTRNYSRFYRQRLRAEALLDAVSAITDVPERFQAMPPGSLSKEIWTHRVDSLFLDAFGRPDPNQDPPCERVPETTMVQALHLMNSRNLADKVHSDNGRAAKWAASELTNDQIIDELYLWAYSRFPTEKEKQYALTLFADPAIPRRTVIEDLLWSLLNSPEFVFKV